MPQDNAALATQRDNVSEFRRLDVYKRGETTDAPRVEALAVISAGYRGPSQGERPGLPKRSMPGDAQQIHLHDPQGRAPGLKAALETSAYRSLLIAFPLDDPAAFIQQRFTRYSASRLEAYGDALTATWIDATDAKNPRHLSYPAGTPEYARIVGSCKADTRIYFCLAEWGESGPEVVFPDGLGFYAIRTTGTHSVRAIQQTLSYTRRFTKRLAGLPFVLELDHREVAGPDGSKRTVPVWTITTRPPEGIRLSSRTFAAIATKALSEGAALMLPAPDAATWEDAAAEGPLVEEPTDDEADLIERGGPCDAQFWEASWFVRLKDTPLTTNEGRERWLLDYTQHADGWHGPITGSLATAFAHATEHEAAALLAEAADTMRVHRQQQHARTYDALMANFYGDEEQPSPPVLEGRVLHPPADAPVVVGAAVEQGERSLPPAQSAPAAPAADLTTALVQTDDGETLVCAGCKERYISMRWGRGADEQVAPVRDWLRFYAEAGGTQPLCSECARKAIKGAPR